MKLLSCLICSVIVLSAPSVVFAAAPAPVAKPPAPSPAPAPTAPPVAPAAAAPATGLKFDDYINELTSTLKLTDDEKKDIVSFYQADGDQLKTLLNSDSITPLEQDRQVSYLRDARNAKIASLLGSADRVAAFYKVESKYRTGLVELATDGGLAPPAPASAAAAPTPAPAPAPAPAAPAAAPVSAKTPPPE